MDLTLSLISYSSHGDCIKHFERVPMDKATTDKTGAFELRGLARTKVQVRAESDTAASAIS